ncbi:MAG TPA: alpha/beta hydrolase [Vicinamibacterales bacterium]|nr:alpha/beta hydrolase [Vicinamibacterales bacterium]
MIDTGHGSPVVLIPGLQGRWEWTMATVEALSAHHRTFSFSLDEVDAAKAPERAFDAWVSEIDRLLDRAGEKQAAIAGVSFGGLVAAYYAARRPQRVSSLVLISAPAPRWRWDHPMAKYVSRPRLGLPVLVARAAGRFFPEFLAIDPRTGARLRFLARHLTNVVRFPASPTFMAACVRAWDATDITAECRRITAPTLVITGEPALDRVVPVHTTLEYLALIRGARHATLERAGHLGVISRPRELAALITTFVDGRASATASAVDKAG